MKLLFLALLALAAGFFWASRHPGGLGRRSYRQQQRKGRPSQLDVRTPWRAVSIRTGDNPCEGAAALGRRRFLLAEAPLTPLAGCNSRRCTCRYDHHNDRRDYHDRRALSPMTRGEDERRTNAGRRVEDQAY